MIITIDGPAGTGKTTIARKLAEQLGFHYFDTGAMYRAVTYLVIKNKISLKDRLSLNTCLGEFQFETRLNNSDKYYFVNGEDVTDAIRSSEVTEKVSEISADPDVRQALVSFQRHFSTGKNVVIEGRDMGTVVFPKADAKFFLTARATVRAERRYLELTKKNKGSLSEHEVLQDLMKRDNYDTSRNLSPLKQAEDAHLIDTSDLTIEQVIDRMLAHIPKKP